MRLALAAALLTGLAPPAQPATTVTTVVRVAPGFTWESFTGGESEQRAALVTPTCVADVWLTLGAGERATTGGCATPAVTATDGVARVEGWDALRRRNDGVALGALADALARTGTCVGADGPLAALAAADSTGLVAEYRPALTLRPGPVPPPRCAVQLTESAAAPDGARTITVRVPSRLHLGAVTVAPAYPGTLVGSPRRPGLVTLPDVTRLVAPVGVGAEPGEYGSGRADAGDLRDLDRFANARQRFNGWWVAGLISFPLLLLIALGLRRRVPARLALVVAAYTPAGFAVSLVPWWRWGPAGTAAAVVAATLALAALGTLVGRRVGSPEVGLATVVTVMFAVDLVTFQQLQRHGLASYSMLSGGRFYGLGNLGFAVFATAVVIVAGAAVRRWGPRAWVWAFVPLTMLDATAGYDFGGVIALAAAAAAALTRRVRTIAVAAVVGLGLALGVAYADARRGDPTHLGRFVSDGEWSETLARKGGAALHSVVGTFWPLLVVGGAYGAYLLLRGRAELRDTARVLAVLWVVGSLVNDSGIVVAGAGLALATPLLVSYAARRA